MDLVECPHCGATVIFDSRNMCPSCLVHKDDPVTTEQQAQIQREREQHQMFSEGPKPATGSYGLGFVVGAILGLIPMVIAILIGGSETKRGAIHGFITRIVLIFVLTLIGLALADHQ